MRFRDLPTVGRAYITAVMLGGGALAIASIPLGAFNRPLLLLSFMAASVLLNTIKLTISGDASSSTLSIGSAVNFFSLLVLGPAATTWTMLAGGWAQCTFNRKTPTPWYQTLFSMGALVVSMQATALTLAVTGGSDLTAPADLVMPAVVVTALVYFVANSVLIAVALGLTSGRSIVKIWDQEFLWGLPNYFIGALGATVALQGIERYGITSVALFFTPLALTYRLYQVYLSRVDRMAEANQALHSLYERAQADSLTDQLTGLPNRRFLTSHVASELARARREGLEVALLLADVDAFKSINDVLGHQQGDRALCAVAASLRQGLRPYDVCGRFGGDEFILMLPHCDAAFAAKRAHELSAAVAASTRGLAQGERPLSISVGVAVFPEDGVTFDALVAAADARMYAEKGRFSSPRLAVG